ncbi:hypothetical protein [uncultured Chitinophaga sp.]|nr:hypothetical protein [uncultured Chitinophaga sp.]
MLIAKFKDQYICCADNGFITMIAGNAVQEIVRLPLKLAYYQTGRVVFE